MLTTIELAGGLIYLLMGGDLLIRGSVALARRVGVSPAIVAFSVVAFGTSLPELVVSVRASLSGYPGLVLGNVVGSNIANVLLVAGMASLWHPLGSQGGSGKKDVTVMMLVSLLLVGLCVVGDLTRWDALLLLAGFAVLLTSIARRTLRAYQNNVRTGQRMEWVLGLPSHMGLIVFFIVAGLVWLPLGADLLVESAIEVAAMLGVPETVVGLTLVAVGTSLPELATIVMAALQQRTEVALGTIIGSNTFNVLAIMGVGAAVSPFPIHTSNRLLFFDLPVMVGAGAILAILVWKDRPIRRRTGLAFLAGYVTYLVVLFANA